jgi:hypothetical protein
MPAPAEPAGASGRHGGAERWVARAFGLRIAGDFPAPGLPATSGRAGSEPLTRVSLKSPEEIDRSWPRTGVQRLLEEDLGGRSAARTIDHHRRAGYRLYARHFGLARISPSGALISCAPPDVAPWSWQRFLVGRILPWAALLRGREVFHASAVRLGDDAIAITGPSGAGKTSLALRLVLGGAGFLTDDVLALERSDGQVLAHPGASIAAVRSAERRAIPAGSWRRIGRLLGRHGKSYVELRREDEPQPVRAIYYLREARAGSREPLISPLEPDPRLLLASTFVLSVRTPQRMRNQLDVCADLSQSARMFAAAVDPTAGPGPLADAIGAHAASLGSQGT